MDIVNLIVNVPEIPSESTYEIVTTPVLSVDTIPVTSIVDVDGVVLPTVTPVTSVILYWEVVNVP